MKTIALVLLLNLFSSSQEKFYHNREMICSFSYTITKDWELKLAETGMFRLALKLQDTRRKEIVRSAISGTWESKGDTIVLKAVAPAAGQCYWVNTRYQLLNGTLKIMDENTCLPALLSPGQMLLE